VLDQHVIFLGRSLCLQIEHVRQISVVEIWTATVFFLMVFTLDSGNFRKSYPGYFNGNGFCPLWGSNSLLTQNLRKYYRSVALPFLRRLVDGLSPHGSKFFPKFLADKVVLGQIFLRVLWRSLPVLLYQRSTSVCVLILTLIRRKSRWSLGILNKKCFFPPEIWACWTGNTFKFSVFKALNLSSVIFTKPSTITSVICLNLH
jgi:hypothetical protein